MTKVACAVLFLLPAEIWAASNVSPLLTFLFIKPRPDLCQMKP